MKFRKAVSVVYTQSKEKDFGILPLYICLGQDPLSTDVVHGLPEGFAEEVDLGLFVG